MAKSKKNALDVTFESDIPKISREGGSRTSKYDDLLTKIRERAEGSSKNKVAVLKFDTHGKATSRYTSIKSAAEDREDAAHWEVAVRTHGDNDVRLYVKWNDEPQEQDEEE